MAVNRCEALWGPKAEGASEGSQYSVSQGKVKLMSRGVTGTCLTAMARTLPDTPGHSSAFWHPCWAATFVVAVQFTCVSPQSQLLMSDLITYQHGLFLVSYSDRVTFCGGRRPVRITTVNILHTVQKWTSEFQKVFTEGFCFPAIAELITEAEGSVLLRPFKSSC